MFNKLQEKFNEVLEEFYDLENRMDKDYKLHKILESKLESMRIDLKLQSHTKCIDCEICGEERTCIECDGCAGCEP